ncbi:ABC transporter permease [Sulfuricaulis limicola]|uniref:ABC transporter permease n=1 Tax=Sulfuricaulis limicola TaxID=1620215 RepID=A0A1B4XI22_9GAMM|nr:ABC transporter permease [Sulfuricaulis limicola]BAV34447.1 ABC transporter permease [Sulfuricaulis limicola]
MPPDTARPPLLLTLAWRNLWRHPRRTLVMLFALVLGIWSMIVMAALIRGSMEEQIRKEILNLTGHVQIHAPGYRDDPAVEHRFAVTPALAEALRTKAAVAASARVRVPAVISSERESAGVVLVGIDPPGERGLSFISKAVTDGAYLSTPDDPGLLLGRKLAEQLETGLGRRVVLMSQDAGNQIADRGFRVVGIFDAEPQAMETGYVFIGLGVAQQMLKIGQDVSEVAVMTPDRKGLEGIVASLRAAAPGEDVAPWTELQPLLVLMERLHNVVLLIWFAVVFTAMAFGLVNTLLMAVFERMREFGLFQALGMPPRFILGQVLVESLILLGIALALGNLTSWISVTGLKGGIDLSMFAQGLELVGMSPVMYPALAAGDVAAANIIVIVLGVLASLYPAWRASRYVPVEAITRT